MKPTVVFEGQTEAPLSGVSLRILDRNGNALPRGQAGLIHESQPEFDDVRYVANATPRECMERNGHITMGDIGFLDDDGYLFTVDRSADMVISGGVNLYPAQIEVVLLTMPGSASESDHPAPPFRLLLFEQPHGLDHAG